MKEAGVIFVTRKKGEFWTPCALYGVEDLYDFYS